MKKVLAIVLAAVMVLCCSMTAFAEIYVDGELVPITGSKTQTEVVVTYREVGNYHEATVQDYGEAPEYVSVSDPGEHLTIHHEVSGKDGESSIVACTDGYDEKDEKGTAAVRVDKDVTESGNNDAVLAYEHGSVSITGDVTESGDGSAVVSMDGSSVSTGKNVTESGDGDAIRATNQKKVDGAGGEQYGDGVHVTVEGNVTEKDEGDAIYAKGQDTWVIVSGNVTESGDGYAIFAIDNSEVRVGGDVTGDGTAIVADTNGRVIVEGVVNGDVLTDNTSAVYIGTLNGEIEPNASKDNIHYLIGTADGSESWKSLIVTGDIDCIVEDSVRGADYNTIYSYTTTADANVLSGKTFNLKSPDSKKKLIVQGIAEGADVTLVSNADGSVTLTLGSNFKGGLQELMLIFENIVRNSGGSTRTINTGTTGNPVTNGKWTQNADGTWSYATAYKFTNTWGCIANPNDANSVGWYYFDRNGNMLTGWQLLTWNGVKKWYYFSQTKDANEGKCLINGITPDGYRVGPDGAWIEG